MRTLLIDNYDSFTYNLYQYLAASNGQAPTVVRNDEMTWPEAERLEFDNIVISPGPGRPQRITDLGLSADAIACAKVPILGVCLGHQAIAHACGGRVELASRPMHGRLDRICHDGRDLFKGIPDRFEAVRYHSLAVTHLPAELEPMAWSPDGTLMALRHRRMPWWGVQFHPESISTEHGARLLRNFRDLTVNWHATKRTPSWGSFLPTDVSEATTGQQWHVQARCLDLYIDPQDVFGYFYRHSAPAFWLDSSLSGPGIARFSFMGDAQGPLAEHLTYRVRERELRIYRQGQAFTRTQSVFDYLHQRMLRQPPEGEDALPFDFAGGFIGYFGYELKEELHGLQGQVAQSPDAAWIFVDRFVAFDHFQAQIWLVGLAPIESPALHESWIEATERWLRGASRSRGEPGMDPLAQTPGALQEGVAEPSGFDLAHAASGLSALTWRTPLADYRRLIERCQHEILMGETYEVCLTNQLSGPAGVDDLGVYLVLRQRNAAPYAAFLRFPGLSVLSASPELFLAVGRDRQVQAKPIKGTAARGLDLTADAAAREALAADEKTRSENLMIVDLLRNDLNRVCEVGSVHVPALYEIESYATVHQMVSTIRGRLREGVQAIDCVRAAFPGGSMTGAPKVRTMQIIDRMEGGARGVYSGSIGYLSTNGAARLNIVIRTIVIEGGKVHIGSGGAVVALSDPDAEVEEIVLKARSQWEVLRACGATLDERDLVVCPPSSGLPTA